MGIIGFIAGVVSSINTRKGIRRMYKGANESNYIARSVLAMPYVDKVRLRLTSSIPEDMDVYDYQSQSATPGLDFVWGENDNIESSVISGGQPDERSRALLPFVHKCILSKTPILALHASNNALITMLEDNVGVCESVSRTGLYYDVFRTMPVEDMAHILYETMDSTGPSVSPLIRALLETVIRKEGNVSLHNLAAFPITKIPDTLLAMQLSGEITRDEYDSIHRDYMAGSAEVETLRAFLGKLSRQADSLYGKARAKTCNMKKVLNQSGAVAIDVGLSNNDLIVPLVINHLKLLQSMGRDFALIIDGVAISRFLPMLDLLRLTQYAICHSDFISSLHGGERTGEELFVEVAGSANVIVLFNHRSGTSCQKWSDHMGKYQKIKVKQNISQADNFAGGLFGSMIGRGNTHSVGREEVDEPRIRAEALSMLTDSLACIHRNEILLAKI
ncbi:MAG: hypothetical protein FWE42_00030 [Defluviitaleaceae bacterium]|nr:hypothetical protein [Defluviitaleaceae bacterium]